MIFWQLFITFFQIGLFTIGGGYAMIPMIEEEVVRQGWLTHTQLVDFIAVAESTPGPFAVNTATYVGITTGMRAGGNLFWGLLGSFLATLGVVLPSFLIILIIAKFFASFQDNRFVKGALYGIHPAVVGLIAAAALSLANGNLYINLSFESISAFFFFPTASPYFDLFHRTGVQLLEKKGPSNQVDSSIRCFRHCLLQCRRVAFRLSNLL